MWHQYLLAVFFIYAGISHFRVPKFFLKITPKWVPKPELTNQIVGIAEVLLGATLLIPDTKNYAAWGIIGLLIVVFPANVYHHQKARAKGKHIIPTLIRLPIQFLLIWWAYQYTVG